MTRVVTSAAGAGSEVEAEGAHGLLDVGHVGRGGGLCHDETPWGEGELVEEMSTPARARASVKAVQPSRAHLTRAGYFETPAKATPSPMTSSSPATWPLEVSIVRMASNVSRAASTGWPMTAPASTEGLATDVEKAVAAEEVIGFFFFKQKTAYEMSVTTASGPVPVTSTRRVTSSPHVGLMWCTSASNGSRRPAWCGRLECSRMSSW